MSRETDRIIAEWLGWKPCRDEDGEQYAWFTPTGFKMVSDIDFDKDSDAITLLPVLVDKGYYCKLEADDYYDKRLWRFDISDGKGMHIKSTNHQEISEAITAAVLQLIDKEVGDEV